MNRTSCILCASNWGPAVFTIRSLQPLTKTPPPLLLLLLLAACCLLLVLRRRRRRRQKDMMMDSRRNKTVHFLTATTISTLECA